MPDSEIALGLIGIRAARDTILAIGPLDGGFRRQQMNRHHAVRPGADLVAGGNTVR